MLGAASSRVARIFQLRGIRLGSLGLMIGLGLALLVQRLLASTQGSDTPPGTLTVAAAVAALMVGMALLATWIPRDARRAWIRLQPSVPNSSLNDELDEPWSTSSTTRAIQKIHTP